MLKRDHGSYTSQEDIQAQIKSVESEIQQQKAALSGAKTVTAKASWHLFRRVRRVRERADGGISPASNDE